MAVDPFIPATPKAGPIRVNPCPSLLKLPPAPQLVTGYSFRQRRRPRLSPIRLTLRLRLWSTLPRWTGSVSMAIELTLLPRRVHPIRSAFPAFAPGRRPHCSFRGLLRLPWTLTRGSIIRVGPSPTGTQPLWGTRGSACGTWWQSSGGPECVRHPQNCYAAPGYIAALRVP
jgi:hypothetical protein